MTDYTGHVPLDAPRLPTGNTEEGKQTDPVDVWHEEGACWCKQTHAIAFREPRRVEVSQRALETVRLPGVRWSPADLDRCEHGRHSIDSCFDCPGGRSVGNAFLLHIIDGKREARRDGERVEVRIGTMVRGEPIWVTARDNPREGETNGC